MIILARNKNKDVDFLLGSNYEGIHARLVEVIGEQRARLFTQPQNRRAKGEHWWYAPAGPAFQSFDKANDATKDEISDLLREQTEDIRQEILDDPELGPLGEQIFVFPDENKLFFRHNPSGDLEITICQWGCSAAGENADGGPLYHLVNRPKKDHSPLNLVATYSNGDVYAGKLLNYRYKNRDKSILTDEEGRAALGLVKNGDQIQVAAAEDDAFTDSQMVINTEHQEDFPIILPYYLDVQVEVLNQKDERMSNHAVAVEMQGQRVPYRSSEVGLFMVERVKLDGSPFRIIDVDNPAISQTYTLDKNTASIPFRLVEQLFAPVNLALRTSADEPVEAFEISAIVGGEERRLTSDDSGEIALTEVLEDSLLVVQKQGEIVARQEFKVKEGTNNFTVWVNPPVPRKVTVTLLDQDGQAIPDTAIDFKAKTGLVQEVTDADGKVILLDPPFADQEKVKATAFLKREGKKPKGKSIKIKHLATQDDYVIQLKKRNWWWLLLLLLPLLLLLLLLEFDKEGVGVHTFEGGTGVDIAGAQVDAGYVRHAFWKSGTGFFAADSIWVSDTSNADGVAMFSGLNYTLYSAIFKRNTEFYVRARTNCHDAGSAGKKFHSIRSGDILEVEMQPVILPLAFQVVDSEDGSPLPDADFSFEYEYNGQTTREELKSDANGSVVVESLSKCGRLLRAHATLYGFYPDSIAPIKIEDLANADPDERVLKLRPLKDNISFFVVNCNTGEPIPRALVTIYVGNDKKGKRFYTNVDGKGKGGYDNLRILDSIRIEGKKPPYFKPGMWPGKATVEEFVKLPDSLRVLCLEPEAQLIKFIDVDSLTGERLVGVTNEVIIVSGDTTTIDTMLSNGNGVIEVPIKIGDKFSIRATHPPGYYPQDRKFREVKADDYVTGANKDITIPLRPVMVRHLFRTVSPLLQKLVDNADLKVTVGGRVVPPTSSGNGEFYVEGRYNDRISIIAKKAGYLPNDYTVDNLLFGLLGSKIPRYTDIPLEIPPCGDKTFEDQSGQNNSTEIVNMGQLSGTFKFKYYTDSQFDKVSVYCGDSTDPSNLIFSNEPPNAPGTKNEEVFLSFNCNSPVITVEVVGNSNWDYTVYCPR